MGDRGNCRAHSLGCALFMPKERRMIANEEEDVVNHSDFWFSMGVY